MIKMVMGRHFNYMAFCILSWERNPHLFSLFLWLFMIVFNHVCMLFFFLQERKEKTDNPLTVPISFSVCGIMMTPASYQWQSWPSQLQPTDLCHFDWLCN